MTLLIVQWVQCKVEPSKCKSWIASRNSRAAKSDPNTTVISYIVRKKSSAHSAILH